MKLPSLSVPEFETKIPSTGQSVKFRPFLVKEEKILLMALEGKDDFEITNAILNLLKSCIITEVDVDNFATFDIEWMFLQIRSKSIGETIELVVSHRNSECKHKTNVVVDLNKVTVKGDIGDGKIIIDPEKSIGVKLRYPNMKDAAEISSVSETEGVFEMLYRCTVMIFDENDVYEQFDREDLIEWYDQLSSEQFEKISDFFREIPKVSYDITWKCSKCGKDDKIVLEGLRNFFM